MPRGAWAFALAVGAGIPIVEIGRGGNYGALLALVAAFIGAYAGALSRAILSAVLRAPGN
jgi:hypothetical protein